MSSEDEKQDPLSRERDKFVSERESQEEDVFGPSLPPHLQDKKRSECSSQQKVYGPVLPENLRPNDEQRSTTQRATAESDKRTVIGPEIPEHLRSRFEGEDEDEDGEEGKSDDEEEGVFGPSPALMSSDAACSSGYKAAFERRSGNKASSHDLKEKQRESWMLELPENKTGIFGLGPRKFRTNIPTQKESDRSVWTETPQDKMKKKKEKDYSELLKAKMLEERNKEMEELAESSSKSKRRKKESLMEMHTKKMKKKRKKEAEKEKEKKAERRPFDRNVDLQIRRIDHNQRKSILNKAMYLNSRFAAGESKFL